MPRAARAGWVSVLAGLLGIGVGGALTIISSAGATQQPQLSLTTAECSTTVTYEVTAPDGDDAARTNGSVGVWSRTGDVTGFAPAPDEYPIVNALTSANGHRFSGTIETGAEPGSVVTVRAAAMEVWGDGALPGDAVYATVTLPPACETAPTPDTTAPPSTDAPADVPATTPPPEPPTDAPVDDAPATPPVDDDGVAPEVEDAAPNGGDGNGDGVPDSVQANVASLPSKYDVDANGALDDYVTIEAPVFTELRNVRALTIPADNPPPDGAHLPAGLFDYDLVVPADGDAADVRVLLPGGEQQSVYMLQHGKWSTFDDHATIDDPSDQVTLHLVDGGAGDRSGADGVINDPFGVGAPGDVGTITFTKVATGGTDTTFTVELARCTAGSPPGAGNSASTACATVDNVETTTVLGGQSKTSGDLSTDNRWYRVRETSIPAGWTLSSRSCTGGQSSTTTGAPSDGIFVRLNTSSGAVCTFTNASNSITARKGGIRIPGQNTTNTFVQGLDGATFEYATNSTFTSGLADLCTTSSTPGPLGTCTQGGISNGTKWVREKTSPPGWDTISTVAYGGGPNGGSADQDYEVSTGNLSGTTAATTRWFLNRLTNPALGVDTCGLRIGLLLDRSLSIDGFEDEYIEAGQGFVNALAGTPTQMKLFSFAIGAQTYNGGSFYNFANAGDVASANTQIANIYNSLEAGTNWDAGFQEVGASGLDAVFIITDGNPIYWQGNTSDINVSLEDVEAGIASANLVKSSGQRVVAIGVGDVTATNLALISGPTQGSDYFTGSVAQLQQTLKNLATELCGGSITVKKEVRTGPNASDFANAPGWQTTVSPAATTVTPADGVTDANGTVNYSYSAGPWPKTVTVTETQQPGYTIEKQDGDPSGGTQLRNAACTVNGALVAVTDTGTAAAPGVTLEVDANDIVACTFRNAPTLSSLQVVKTTNGSSGGPFEFTVTGPNGTNQSRSATTNAPATPINAGEPVTNLFPGQYTVTESSLPAGWDLADLSCTGATDNGAPDLLEREIVVTVGAAQSVTCTFTNSSQVGQIVVVKQATGGEATFSFALTQDGDPVPDEADLEIAAGPVTPTDDGTAAWTDVAAGTYAVSEQVPEGWDLTQATCSDGSPVDAVEVSGGETVTCTFANTKRASVVIRKTAIGAGPGSTFDFSVPAAFDVPDDTVELTTPAGGGTTPSSTFVLPAGVYPVTELTPPEGWDFTSVTCDDGSPTAGPTATIELAAGEDVVCTWTNTKRATLTIVKDGVGQGTGAEFDFAVPSAFGEPGDTLTLTTPAGGGTDSKTFTLPPASYTVTEATPPEPWVFTDLTCEALDVQTDGASATVVLAAGEEASCTWTNSKLARVTIEKDAVGEGLGRSFGFDVPAQFGEPDDTLTLTTPDGGGTESKAFTVPAGTYDVTEQEILPEPADWLFTDLECSNDSEIDGRTASIDVAEGEEVTCTWTNTQLAQVTVEKIALGRDETTFDFSVPPAFDQPDDTLSLTPPAGDGSAGFVFFVPAGTYPVTEDALPDGWDLTSLVCTNDSEIDGRTADIDVEAGEQVTCTWTNTQRPENGNIVIQKLGVGEGAGATFDFSVPAELAPSGAIELTTPTGGGTDSQTFSVPPNTDTGYAVSELVPLPDGWDFTDLECTDPDGQNPSVIDGETATIFVSSSETVTCTWTNTKRGDVTIEKVGVGVGAGAAFEFSVPSAFGALDDTVTLTTPTDGGSASQSFVVVPGTYEVSEDSPLPEGWDFTDLECTNDSEIDGQTADIDVAAGESVTCTWTNTKRGDVTIEKVGVGVGAGAAFDFSVPPAFDAPDDTVTLTTPDGGGSDSASFSVAPGTYDVTEDAPLPDGWTFTSLECTNDSDITERTAELAVAAGEQVTCTWTNSKLPGSVTIEKTAIGADGATFDFSVPAAFGAPDDTVSITTPNGGGTVAAPTVEVPEGTYPVSEIGPPDGWDFTSLECSNDSEIDGRTAEIAVAAGEAVTCTWTNTQRADLTIVKLADGSGPAQEFDFSVPGAFDVPGDTLTLTTPTGGGSDSSSFSVAPGTYDVTEDGPPSGWQLTSLECTNDSVVEGATASIAVSAGESVTCTWTNAVTTARVEVVKQVAGSDVEGWTFDGSITEGPAHFTGGATAEARTTAGDPPIAAFDLERVPSSGTPVLLAEQLQVGYGFAGVSCVVVPEQGQELPIEANADGATATPVVQPDQLVRCTFVNNVLPASISLVKTASATTVVAGSDTSFSIVVTNDGQVPLTNVVVTDPVPTSTTFVSATVVDGNPGVCSEAAGLVSCTLDGTLDVGETSTIALVVNVPATTTPTTIVNVANVTGDPPVCEPTSEVSALAGECPVTSTDDASVPVVGVGGESTTVDAPRIVAGTLPFTGPPGAAALKAGAWLLALGGIIQLTQRRRHRTARG